MAAAVDSVTPILLAGVAAVVGGAISMALGSTSPCPAPPTPSAP
nr:hypothetical protein [Tessaracoccus coleopterorum]